MQSLTFGIGVSTSAAPGADPVAEALTAEHLGFDFVSASDHPSGNHPTYETWTLLTWIAATTMRIKVATRVLSVPFRSPALVAKMAESLDRLSEGRFILGLGAGATDGELRAFGLPAPSPRQKIDGLEDAVRIIRGLWSEPAHTYTGPVHHANAAALEPKPAHRIPIWLGTFGNRALTLTGRHADGWIPSLGYVSAAELTAMRGRVVAAAQAAGRDPDDITCALNLEIHIGRASAEHPDALSGSSGQVAASLRDFVRAGFTSFNFMPVGDTGTHQTEQIATEVIPALRALVDR
jgi:alkanesulfonate monooxygenase SsuD/methylene tetrahydromethanopterin reductase-like flavin-dependent oxidoreductase (luciferase family)